MKKHRNSIGDFIEEVASEKIAANVSVKLAPATIPILVVSIMAAVVLGIVGSHYLLKAINKK